MALQYRNELCRLGELLWNFQDYPIEEIIEHIKFCVSNCEISLQNIFSVLDQKFSNNHKMSKQILQFIEQFLTMTGFQFPKEYDFFSEVLMKILKLKGLIDPDVYPEEVKQSVDELLSQYDFGEIEEVIANDDLDALDSIYSSFGFESDRTSPSDLDLAAEYGSIKCFRYLYENGSVITSDTTSGAFLGNNYDIINICEQNSAITSDYADIACIYHHNDEYRYLSDKYSLDYSWYSSLVTFNFELFFDKLDRTDFTSNNEEAYEALSSAACLGLTPIVRLFLEKGCSPLLQDNSTGINCIKLAEDCKFPQIADIMRNYISK
ncbi:hypothetical protein TVAG_395520 [Trichomonas vaginalis G3]|uniref:DUF3447 domain-containing protein n=1 Tax=Trichomonas vaginalis (strain ATCC PRA-98 / G3) TaxID=412133 RepID=A2F1E1_TRIV3|nr:spectrin binding [Trichomonas vaginalis G3]EAY01305.1 hypothetical protein TVAG_395520 [Trichomonas vaginalis G3]KAI5542835.1 spectrin binding [Trichomonas vaginalis G3]|eukprot:XP_001330173.1 hypothetical protein [Trichomonas vaginalis G3]